MDVCTRIDIPKQSRPLTDQQQRVCDLLLLGLSNKEISARLDISHRTVEQHRAEVFRKLDVRNVVELVRLSLGNAVDG